MIKICGKGDKSNTYKGFSFNISLFIQGRSSVGKEWNITNKPLVSVWLIHFSSYLYHLIRFTKIYDCSIYIFPHNRFQDFLVQTFKIVADSWKFGMLLIYIWWDDCPNFMITGSNEQLQQELKYTLLKLDCHSWWISKMQSGREDTLEERNKILF